MNLRNNRGQSALLLAVEEDSPDIARALLERGARVNDKNALEKTALEIAEEKLTGDAKTEMVLLLKKAGAQ